jgi:hypothetical protein
MTRLLALLLGSVLASQSLASPFEKLLAVPEGELLFVICAMRPC